MNKSESKYYNTARLMDQALLLLLDKKDFDYITVKELCAKASVNRSTFYLHYDNMTDLLTESIEFLFGQLKVKYVSLISGNAIRENELEELRLFTPEYSIPYLEFIKENKRAFMSAVNNQSLFRVEKTFKGLYESFFEPILARYGIPDGERKFYIKYYLSGIHAVIIEWIQNGCKEEIPFIAHLIVKCINAEI